MTDSVMAGMAFRGIVSSVPRTETVNARDYPWFDAGEIRKITAMVGIHSRRVADASTCSSDLCCSAGRRLLELLSWPPESIDGLILVTQTPDYIMPPSSCLIQNKLGLPKTCASFDVSLGCSAYVYGLWLANALLASGGCHRILLMAGDTASKYVNPRDRTTALLFGDAGSATALEKTSDPAMQARYILNTDGTGAQDLIVPGGGFRTRFPKEDSECWVFMNGAHIFDFTRTRIPELVNQMLAYYGAEPRSHDLYIFHQANQYLVNFIARQCNLESSRVPLFLKNFGNVSAASIPLTFSLSRLPPADGRPCQVMFIGFGVGLSWGAVSLPVPSECRFDHIEYQDDTTQSP
jgi:3-oxoacyl-[acyl-carrier-protein] synthase-3